MKPVVWTVFFLGATLVAARGQCTGDPVHVGNPSVETIGGITYLNFTYETVCPLRLWRKPAVVQGTNVNQSVVLVPDFPGICTLEYPPTVHTNQATLVLGTFAPGDYLCRIYTIDPFGGSVGSFGNEFMAAAVPFTVPATSSTISLFSVGAGQIVFRVDGTSNVTYGVESSSTLTNWTSFRMVSGAPFTVTNQPEATTFYRVRIIDGIPTCQ